MFRGTGKDTGVFGPGAQRFGNDTDGDWYVEKFKVSVPVVERSGPIGHGGPYGRVVESAVAVAVRQPPGRNTQRLVGELHEAVAPELGLQLCEGNKRERLGRLGRAPGHAVADEQQAEGAERTAVPEHDGTARAELVL